jgi:hypothetical protein
MRKATRILEDHGRSSAASGGESLQVLRARSAHSIALRLVAGAGDDGVVQVVTVKAHGHALGVRVAFGDAELRLRGSRVGVTATTEPKPQRKQDGQSPTHSSALLFRCARCEHGPPSTIILWRSGRFIPGFDPSLTGHDGLTTCGMKALGI